VNSQLRRLYFAHLSKVDHVPILESSDDGIRIRTSCPEEFASLLTVGNTCAVREPPAVIPAEHSARLIELGYIPDLAGRLRMTTAGRSRIATEFENRPLLNSNQATEGRNRPVPNVSLPASTPYQRRRLVKLLARSLPGPKTKGKY
jgi:hypothetical protein